MTALFPSTHGMWDCTHTQRREWVDVPASRFTYFSHHLERAGYCNAYFGKWHVEQSSRLEDFGWHEYDLRCGNARGRPVPGTEVIVPREGYRDYLLAAVSEEPHTHPAFDRGIEFLRRRAGADQPFFCVVSTTEPHDAYVPPRRFFEQYDPGRIRLSPTLRDPVDGKPEVVRRLRAVWQDLTGEDWRKIAACYWAVVSFLDGEVGRILDILKETGQDERTIVVFTADHGDMMGGHGLLTKGIGTPYEEVYNVPLIVRIPGLSPRGEESRFLLSTVDIAPTLLDLCGADPLPAAQGRSFRPVLEGTADPADWQDAYAEFFGQRFMYTQRIAWHANWKYVFSPGGIDELYDLNSDPHERINLAGDPARRDVLVDMVKRMWRRMEAIGDESLFNTHYATLRTAPVGPLSIAAD
jgi:arylsulfatase A-like enzyme